MLYRKVRRIFVKSGTDDAALTFWGTLDYRPVFLPDDMESFKSFSQDNTKLGGVKLLQRNKQGKGEHVPFCPKLERDTEIERMAQ